MPRLESPIHPDASPELKRLVNAMRETKAANPEKLSYKDLAVRAHFSTASLGGVREADAHLGGHLGLRQQLRP
ncbi:hypothetical protein ACWC2M_30295 [Streptomyces sp. NPDC001761]